MLAVRARKMRNKAFFARGPRRWSCHLVDQTPFRGHTKLLAACSLLHPTARMAAATKEADAEKKSILTKIGMDSIGIEVRVIDDCIAVCARKGFGAGHRIFSEQTSIVFPRKVSLCNSAGSYLICCAGFG